MNERLGDSAPIEILRAIAACLRLSLDSTPAALGAKATLPATIPADGP